MMWMLPVYSLLKLCGSAKPALHMCCGPLYVTKEWFLSGHFWMIQAETNLGVGTSTLRVSVIYTRSSHGYSYFSNFGWSFSFSPSSERNERYTDSYQRNSKNLRKKCNFRWSIYFDVWCRARGPNEEKKQKHTHLWICQREEKGRKRERKKEKRSMDSVFLLWFAWLLLLLLSLFSSLCSVKVFFFLLSVFIIVLYGFFSGCFASLATMYTVMRDLRNV